MYDKYGIKCAISVKRYKELVNLSRKQERRIVFKVLKKALSSAKHDLVIDELRPLLYQNEVITSEEATELRGIILERRRSQDSTLRSYLRKDYKDWRSS